MSRTMRGYSYRSYRREEEVSLEGEVENKDFKCEKSNGWKGGGVQIEADDKGRENINCVSVGDKM